MSLSGQQDGGHGPTRSQATPCSPTSRSSGRRLVEKQTGPRGSAISGAKSQFVLWAAVSRALQKPGGVSAWLLFFVRSSCRGVIQEAAPYRATREPPSLALQSRARTNRGRARLVRSSAFVALLAELWAPTSMILFESVQ